MNATLTATHKGKTERKHLTDLVDDNDAMMFAIPKIMDLAYTKEVWAKGMITLTDDADGRIIQMMPAKD